MSKPVAAVIPEKGSLQGEGEREGIASGE